MFISSLFTVAKAWKQSKCPSINEWIKKMWYIHGYIYTMDYYSAIKKEIMPFAGTWMDLEITYKYQTEKDKYYITSLTCRI